MILQRPIMRPYPLHEDDAQSEKVEWLGCTSEDAEGSEPLGTTGAHSGELATLEQRHRHL